MIEAESASALSRITPQKTLIVGSTGRMGAMLCARAHVAGLTVCGVDQPLTDDTLRTACADAELAIVCVPAAVFEDVLQRICPHLSANAVLADITSVKEQPMRQMEASWGALGRAVVGTHPLFGPKPDAQTPLTVTITPGTHATATHTALTEGFFTAWNCHILHTTAEKHDQAMARIQNMNFITNVAYFAMLAGQDDLLPYLTPSFHRRLNAARKMLTEDAAMFSGLFEANAHSQEVVRQYRHILSLAAAGDIDLLCRRAQWWFEEQEQPQPK